MDGVPEGLGGYPTMIEGRTFVICTEAEYEEASDKLSGRWRAWSFFAYDRELNIYPSDAVPPGVSARESIAGASGECEVAARRAVEDKLRAVVKTKNLAGTGFYSPPGGFVYPQELPTDE